ncbi:putative UDP-glycosyltransferase 72B1 [Hypsibius exemplaris]|uniref:UDP-glucuronosyltransferase n=1 Tax=Hypsibius exemplaris TaxID=2072580 RepID=A0A1W0XAE8_HYPEX|nr:putative UDP-glycosyltransferase 72B1 [Hypsibius exemplaris]
MSLPNTVPRRKVLLLNFIHYGHILPLLELGKKLSQYHDVDFVVATARIPEIQSRGLLPSEGTTATTGSLNLADLRDGLSLDACNVIGDGAVAFVQRLNVVVDAFNIYLESHAAPDIIIADHFLHRAAKISHLRGIPFYFFHTASALSALEVYDAGNKPGMEFEDGLYLLMKEATVHATGIIISTARELHPDAVAKLEANPALSGKDLRLVGPIFAPASSRATEQAEIWAWLDHRPTGSVVYVSFGSLICPAPKQLYELGRALFLLGKPFILSLRTAQRHHLPEELHSGAPGDGRDFLIAEWAPQKMILGHPSLAVFVSHCGWNSATEAILGGVPVVGWPFNGDQYDNSEWFRVHGIGEKFAGTGQRSEKVLAADEIARLIRKVADWDGSAEGSYKRKAVQWSAVLRNAIGPTGSSTKDFEQLAKF